MSYKKIPKSEWDLLSQSDKDFYTLKFNEDVEKRKRIVIFVTRLIALLLIGALFYIGWVQLEVTKGATNAIQKYGSLGYCYLCGYENLRTCDCTYNQIDWGVETNNIYSNRTLLREMIAEQNIRSCNITKEAYGSRSINYPDINFSELGGIVAK